MMRVQLFALSGPLIGTTVPVGEVPLIIGRARDCGLSVPDARASRHHCELVATNGRLTLRDLGSRNGTFVNGLPATGRSLGEGDQIRVGDSLFVVMEDAPPSARARVVEAAVDLSGHSTIIVPPVSCQAPASIARSVNEDHVALLSAVGTTLRHARSLTDLQQRLLRLALAYVPADCGAVWLVEDARDEAAHLVTYHRDGDLDVPVSQELFQAVVAEPRALLHRTPPTPGNARPESTRPSATSTFVCAPLTIGDAAVGAIQLASRSDALTEGHVRLVSALADIAAPAIGSLRQVAALEREQRRREADDQIAHAMVGESPAMRRMYQFLARVAPTESTVLIRGESGTGKELVAQALHLNSPRAAKPFVAVNCAALTESLLESELFGHERGAFTGAVTQKRGRFELAQGGTVFLDEVGELATPLQAKLLRVLQEHQVWRVGGTQPIQVNVRVIAATNRDLDKAIAEGRFRQDLFFRLNVVTLTTPPLRERREDIEQLASVFLERHAATCRRRVREVSSEALDLLRRYDWPGNVRELENAIERAVVLGVSERVEPEDLPESIVESVRPGPTSTGGYHGAVLATKRQVIVEAVAKTNGRYSEAARLLGVHPNYLHRLITQLGLRDQLGVQHQ